MKRLSRFMALAAFAASLVFAQDISGDWQGTLNAGPRELRTILQVKEGDSGEWKARAAEHRPEPGSRRRDGNNLIFAEWFPHQVRDPPDQGQLRWHTQR